MEDSPENQAWLGDKEDELEDYSQDDRLFLETTVTQVRQRPDGMIELPLPFRDFQPVLTCNQNYARTRTKKVTEKLKKDPQRLASTLDNFQRILT